MKTSQKAKLGDICTIKTGKIDSNAAVEGGKYPFFTCAQETFSIDKFAFDTEAVLLGGNNANGIFPLKYYQGKFNAYQRTYIIESKDGTKVLNKFVYFSLRPVLNYFKSASIGAATQYLTKPLLDNLKINLPDVDTQRSIIDIVYTYDDLIIINHHRIQLLEESARLLFREWFVYFRFPGHEKIPIVKDGISKTPEGWVKEKVINVVKRVAPGELYDQTTAIPTGIVPILDQGQSGIIGYHNNKPSVIASLDNPVIVFANHTCNQRIIHFPFSAIQNIFPFLPSDENFRNIYWLHYATDNLVQLNAYKGHWPEFMAKNILLPPKDLCDEFGSIISLIHKQIFYLSIQNQKLAQARDLLLPRLMSGAIVV